MVEEEDSVKKHRMEQKGWGRGPRGQLKGHFKKKGVVSCEPPKHSMVPLDSTLRKVKVMLVSMDYIHNGVVTFLGYSS